MSLEETDVAIKFLFIEIRSQKKEVAAKAGEWNAPYKVCVHPLAYYTK